MMFLVPIFIRGHGISNYELPERVMVALFVSYSALLTVAPIDDKIAASTALTQVHRGRLQPPAHF